MKILFVPGTLNLYYNPTPMGDWSNPDTFSSGIMIGRYQIAAQEFVQLLTVTRAVGTLILTFSRDFSFNGKTYNLRKLLPAYTFDDTISNTPGPGISDADLEEKREPRVASSAGAQEGDCMK